MRAVLPTPFPERAGVAGYYLTKRPQYNRHPGYYRNSVIAMVNGIVLVA